jgi:apolipoprotein N-acyltransferase
VNVRSPGVRAALLGAGALASGAVIAFSLPPLRLWFLGPIGLGGLAAIGDGRRARVRFGLGAIAGVGQFTIASVWAFQFTGWGYLILVVFESLLVGVACLLVAPSRGRLLGFAAAIALLEAVRDAFPFGGVPLGGVALGQASGPLLGLARIDGPILVVAAVALFGAALASVALGVAKGGRAIRSSLGKALPGCVALAVVVGAVFGAAEAPNGGPVQSRETVSIVQGGGRRGVTTVEESPTSAYPATLAVLERISDAPKLIVTPEDALALLVPPEKSARARRFARFATRLHATLLAGVTWPVGTSRFRNELVAFGPTGRVVASIEKVHPVPFGEYVPFRSFIKKIVSLEAVPRDVIVGHSDSTVRTPAGRLVLLNSFEAFFPTIGRRGVTAGGELLVVETNTSSYGSSQVPAMELAASRIQAVAEGRTLVQAATTGYSAVIAIDGSVFQRSSLGRADLIDAVIGLRKGRTWYDDAGDTPVIVAAGVLLCASWLLDPRVTRQRQRVKRARPR